MMQPERSDEITSEPQPSTADVAAAGTMGTRTGDETPDRGDTVTHDDGATVGDARGPLLGQDELEGYRLRWQTVQVRFVDEPRETVKEADTLVAELMQRLAQTFSEERSVLESQWERGTDVSTEDLRLAMQRYRSFFDRLLAA